MIPVPVTAEEVEPGLVTYLDPAKLTNCQGCTTNLPDLTRIPNRDGPFLILAEEEPGQFLAVPLFGAEGVDGLKCELDNDLKIGPGSGWRNRVSYWHTHHFWIIPAACVEEASTREFNARNARKRYPVAELATIIDHRNDSPVSFRPPISN